MAHRGRLNVLANIVGKSYGEIFREFEGDLDPDSVQGSGDVKYHKGASGTFVGHSGAAAAGDAGLEPVASRGGRPRGRGDGAGQAGPVAGRRSRSACLSLLIHGDAAFAGQGVVAETLELSQLAGYRTGGTVHVVVNNQLGFTTAPESARSSVYPTDVAKMVQAPVFHVNGDDPEACARAARLAFGFRQTFHKDVVIDVVCYRRFGHNEGDDPELHAAPDVRHHRNDALGAQALHRGARPPGRHHHGGSRAGPGRLPGAAADGAGRDPPGRPPEAHDRCPWPPPPAAPVRGRAHRGRAQPSWSELVVGATAVPEGFTIHPKLARQFEQRAGVVADGEVDWALGEALAIGSLLLEGTDVRLAGQDTRRGTFSQRHAVLVDYATGDEWVPLAHLAGRGGSDTSPSTTRCCRSTRHSASNTAIRSRCPTPSWRGRRSSATSPTAPRSSSTTSWWRPRTNGTRQSGLVLLLPHGYEGQGPEHSSARIERFLTLCARGNMRLAQPTTAAQYFHLLRSQVRGAGRQPLVVFTPKSLLRARPSRSPLAELTTGSFRSVVDDPAASGGGDPPVRRRQPRSIDPAAVQRVLLCSGKVAFDAMARRDQLAAGTAGSARPGRGAGVGGRRPGRAALSVARGGAGRRSRPLPFGPRGGLGPGGAGEHGGLVVRPRPAAPAAARPVHPDPREPDGVGQPGHRERGAAPPGARGPPGPRLRLTGRRFPRSGPPMRSAQGDPDDGLELDQGLGGVDDLDRLHAEGPGGLQVHPEIVEEDGGRGLDRQLGCRP